MGVEGGEHQEEDRNRQARRRRMSVQRGQCGVYDNKTKPHLAPCSDELIEWQKPAPCLSVAVRACVIPLTAPLGELWI